MQAMVKSTTAWAHHGVSSPPVLRLSHPSAIPNADAISAPVQPLGNPPWKWANPNWNPWTRREKTPAPNAASSAVISDAAPDDLFDQCVDHRKRGHVNRHDARRNICGQNPRPNLRTLRHPLRPQNHRPRRNGDDHQHDAGRFQIESARPQKSDRSPQRSDQQHDIKISQHPARLGNHRRRPRRQHIHHQVRRQKNENQMHRVHTGQPHCPRQYQHLSRHNIRPAGHADSVCGQQQPDEQKQKQSIGQTGGKISLIHDWVYRRFRLRRTRRPGQMIRFDTK